MPPARASISQRRLCKLELPQGTFCRVPEGAAVAEQLSFGCRWPQEWLGIKMTMKILADAESALKEVERDSNRLRSKDLRKAIQQQIDEQREAIKALRRLYN